MSPEDEGPLNEYYAKKIARRSKKTFSRPLVIRAIIFVLTVFSIVGFFYFEPSSTLRILIIILAAIGILYILKTAEIATYLLLYLAVYDSYNAHYGFSIPFALLMFVVFFLSHYLFVAQARLGKFNDLLEKNTFSLFAWVTALAILEFFSVMDFWPVNPMTKALILVVMFFFFGRVFYLFANSMLSFKRTLSYIVTSLVIFSVVIFLNLQFGL